MNSEELRLKAAKEFVEYVELIDRGEHIDQDFFENLIERHAGQMENLQNPTVVLVNMMRKSIATPSWESAHKIYPEKVKLERELQEAKELASNLITENQCLKAKLESEAGDE